jgi:hypothetical protein
MELCVLSKDFSNTPVLQYLSFKFFYQNPESSAKLIIIFMFLNLVPLFLSLFLSPYFYFFPLAPCVSRQQYRMLTNLDP